MTIKPKSKVRCHLVTTQHGFYVDTECCGLDWVFGAEDEGTWLRFDEAERTAHILNQLGISAEVKTYE